jgi:hypothetical protein
MKWMLIIMMSWLALQGRSQSPRPLQVTSNKTTNLVFPAMIAHVDRGSERISVQASAENILRVKADTAFADTTNLTVITTDGKLYSFLISYHRSPAILNIDLGTVDNVLQDTALTAIAVKVRARKNTLHGINFRSGGVSLSLYGLYTNGQVIACKLVLENASPFLFELGRVHCYRTAVAATRRAPRQEIEVAPILIAPLRTLLKPRQPQVVCLLFQEHALSPGQSLRIELDEQHGERQLVLVIRSKFLLAACDID